MRHDVMAHIKAYGDQAKLSAPIIHLGATSCFVDCNSELIIIDHALKTVKAKLVNVIKNLKDFALKYKKFTDAWIYASSACTAYNRRQARCAVVAGSDYGLSRHSQSSK